MVVGLTPIGVIHTPFRAKEDAPIQGAFHPEHEGIVEVFPQFEEGLTDIDDFTHLFIIYQFDRATSAQMHRKVFLSDEPHGLFATRHPARPNPIGLTIVRLFGREGVRLKVGGIDVLDGTPLLDIKPYVRRFDSFPDASEGWFEGRDNRPKPPGRE